MDLPHALGNLAQWQLVPADSNEQYHYQENPLHSLEFFLIGNVLPPLARILFQLSVIVQVGKSE